VIFQGILRKYPRKERSGQMNTYNISKSRKIYIRREKARIRRNVFDLKEQEKQISVLSLTNTKA
jgi:hypothetical protein